MTKVVSDKRRIDIAIFVRAAQRRMFTLRMTETDFLPESLLGRKVDAASRRIIHLIMSR